MSDNFDRYKDGVWDRFFDFVSQPLETMSRDEVQSELRKRGIDVTRAIRRVRESVAAARARAALRTARVKRQSMVEKLTPIAAPSFDRLRERIKDIIAGNLQGAAQAAYFRKLENAANEEDLRALLDDVERLEALSEDDESQATNG